jgi:alkanesulfonate monooxygenase SsuD/methylene tetrahydromethanopterin reductase-like flavin-dependent oxidoreductase (luciferase family)/FAD/FMN-containing dehydrogenase
MTDYGHDLLFGTFITPQSQRPQDAVTLAQLTEQSGLDLATFQDHPYQPAFLDTWTLLSWVAARTERVRVSANVLNLPLRPPGVLARAAASLDLLSGGRFELGLGAGAFWDAIEAMGGPRRTPAEAVTALSEAIDIIRAIWDGSTRGGVFLDGEQYHVRGAKRGPEPSHDISIWLGALKPRMLRLIGEKADGWLPSMAYLQDGDLERGNSLIDEAAAAAGRDPREIRRLLNVSGAFVPENQGFLQGTPEQWVDELLPLAVEQGISTFILAGDDPRAIQLFGAEVAPALREAVAGERQAAGNAAGEVVRGPKALALRRDGIDYDGLPRALRARAIEPGDRNYAKVRSTYMRTGSPGLVIRPESAAEAAEALAFARAQRGPLAVRSGGHGISGRSTNDGGVVIDVSGLNQVEVLDPAAGQVRVGPGARWGHVAGKLLPYGLAISSGDFGDVGAGGIGFLGRRYGLTIDHVAAAELVLADGTQVRADAREHPDLFWALRGAGGNFGIVTALELHAYPVRDVIFSPMVFDATSTAALMRTWGELVEEAPRELTSFLYLFAQRGASPVGQLLNVFAGDDTEAAVAALTPLLKIGPLLDQQAQLSPYAAVIPASGSQHDGGQSRPLISNGLTVHLTPEIGDLVAEGLRSRVAPWVSIRAVGGAVNDIDPAATAYAHRHQNFNVSSVGSAEGKFRRHWDELRPYLDGLYTSFETDDRPERLSDAFPGATLTRLRRLKATYDPANIFNANFPIPPDPRGVRQAGRALPAEMAPRASAASPLAS